MGNTKKASKKRLLRRKTKKQNTKQSKPESNANPAAGMSRLEYQQALMDPRFRAAMVGFNGSVGMGSQQSAQLRELELKSNEIMRNINFQEQKAALTKDLEEKKKEQRKLDDEYEMKRVTDKHNQEVETLNSKIRKTERESKQHDELEPLNRKLRNLNINNDIKDQEQGFKDKKSRLLHETRMKTRMQQIEAELDELKDLKDHVEDQYERSQLERQYRDKRKQYEQERIRLEAKLNYDIDDEYIIREVQAAVEMDRAKRDLDAVKHVAELKDRTEQAKRATVEGFIRVLGDQFDYKDNDANKKNLNAMHHKLVKDTKTLELMNGDLKDVEDAYNDNIKAKRAYDNTANRVNALVSHKPDPIYNATIRHLQQGIITKKLQNEEIEKIGGQIKSVLDDTSSKEWNTQKTMDEFLTKVPNAQIIGKRVARKKRGTENISYEDWPDIVNTIETDRRVMQNAMNGPLKDFDNTEVKESFNQYLNTLSKQGVDTTEMIDKLSKQTASIEQLQAELQSRQTQADKFHHAQGYYANKLATIYNDIPKGERRFKFLMTYFPRYADRKQILDNALEANEDTPPAIGSEYVPFDSDAEPEYLNGLVMDPRLYQHSD